MATNILDQVYQYAGRTNTHWNTIKKSHLQILAVKGSILHRAGQIMDSYYLVDRGVLRSYVTDIHLQEITTTFYARGDIAMDTVSVFMHKPSETSLEALTDTVLWKISFQDFQYLFARLKGFSEWGRSWMTQELLKLQERNIQMITKTAAQRYALLQAVQPEVIQHAPLKYIASYLGIQDTSLSRIRRQEYLKSKQALSNKKLPKKT
jgi:CRP/FNR family transcriptional regulator, anaerobic regulatory protein